MNVEPESERMISLEDALRDLGALYARVEAEIARHAPVCELSGRCCRFREFGHDLFVSGLEREYWFRSGEPAISADRWKPGENCPWQSETGRCHARLGRPLGCRVYFCDPSFGPFMPDVMEPAISAIKRITRQAGMEWDYRPAHEHLAVTERIWRITPSDRHLRDTAASETDSAAISGNSLAVGDS